MTFLQASLLFAAAVFGGALNSVAGGGTFLTFPTLIFVGVNPVSANTTSTVALWPGVVASATAYRGVLSAQRHLLILGGASLVGGVLGAVLLMETPQAAFERLIPYLLLLATLLFSFGGALTRWLGVGERDWQKSTRGALALAALAQLVIAIYGGFFGGGIGVLMLATLSLMGMKDIHAMNGLKAIFAACINAVAVLVFVLAGSVVWPVAVVMVLGATVGGYWGAYYAQRINQRLVRLLVMAVGYTMTAYFFMAM